MTCTPANCDALLDALTPRLQAREARVGPALATVRSWLDEGADPQELGDLDSLADALAELHPRTTPAPSVAGARHPAPLTRLIDPMSTRLWVPRTIGWGWDLNFGALAARLGLVRSDDVDDEVISAAGARVHTAVGWAPGVLAGAGLALGRVRGTWNGRGLAQRACAVAALGAWQFLQHRRAHTPSEHLGVDTFSTCVATIVLAEAAGATRSPLRQVAAVGAVAAAGLAPLVITVRAGLARMGRKEHQR